MSERKSIYRKEFAEELRQITNDVIVSLLNNDGHNPYTLYRARRLAQYSQEQKEEIAQM